MMAIGHIFADIELSNPSRPELHGVAVKALADAGALMLCIPEHVALQLEVARESEREVSVADGRKQKVPYFGPIRVRFGDRTCFVGALVLGDEVRLGAVPMEDMDLVLSPGRRELTVDPASPNIPHARVKMLHQSDIWPAVRAVLRADRWTPLQRIYDHIARTLPLDDEDHEPQSPSSDIPKWKLNVRACLQYRKGTREILWDENQNYRIPG